MHEHEEERHDDGDDTAHGGDSDSEFMKGEVVAVE